MITLLGSLRICMLYWNSEPYNNERMALKLCIIITAMQNMRIKVKPNRKQVCQSLHVALLAML